jgi:hypothetical protein
MPGEVRLVLQQKRQVYIEELRSVLENQFFCFCQGDFCACLIGILGWDEWITREW